MHCRGDRALAKGLCPPLQNICLDPRGSLGPAGALASLHLRPEPWEALSQGRGPHGVGTEMLLGG